MKLIDEQFINPPTCHKNVSPAENGRRTATDHTNGTKLIKGNATLAHGHDGAVATASVGGGGADGFRRPNNSP